MGEVGAAHGHYHVASADVHLAAPEGFLQPELFQGDFAATLDLLFELAGLFLLDFHCRLYTAVLELNLRVETPAVPEIIA